MTIHHPVQDLQADTPFGQAVRAMVWTRFQSMWKQRDGTLAGDVEALHDMRVGSRRLRAALDMAAATYADPEHAAFQHLTEKLTAELGAVRDGDVLLETLRGLAASTGPDGRLAADALTKVVAAERTVARTRLLVFLDYLDTVSYADDAARLWQS